MPQAHCYRVRFRSMAWWDFSLQTVLYISIISKQSCLRPKFVKI
ncbi:hypothetical protein HMPREF1870_02750 [Bacteroidales bacterium KA00344]|nr:hypothetical protein HMPREF1870_02750 [Bacteroidales bacterium KA00344]